MSYETWQSTPKNSHFLESFGYKCYNKIRAVRKIYLEMIVNPSSLLCEVARGISTKSQKWQEKEGYHMRVKICLRSDSHASEYCPPKRGCDRLSLEDQSKFVI